RVRAAPEKLLQGIVVEFGKRETAQLAAFERGDCETVAEEHAIVRDRRDARLRRHDSDEIERIGAGERDQLAASLQLPHGAQAPDRIGERKLLAAEARDEAPAADLAARFQPPVYRRELAPSRQARLAREQGAENHAIAAQQGTRDLLDALAVVGRGVAAQDGPASGGVHFVGGPAAARTPLVFVGGREQRAQAPEAVRRGEAQACELAERALGLRAQLPRGGHDLVEERCAPRAQRRVYGARLRAELPGFWFGG